MTTDKLPNIGVNPYTVRDFLKTPEDIKASLKKIKEIGYNSIQMSGIARNQYGYFGDCCDELGISITATHVGIDMLRYNFKEIVDLHKRYGCIDVGIGSAPDEARKTAKGFSIFASEMNKFGKDLAENGLRLMYHNHSFEFDLVDGKKGMYILFDEFDPRYVDFEIDTYWIKAGGEDPEAWIRKVAGRMRVIHLKDYILKPDCKPIYGEVGNGSLDWDGITRAIVDTGVLIGHVEQDVCPGDPFESIASSLNFLKSKGYRSWKV